MFEKIIEFFSINNPIGINRGLLALGIITQCFFLLTAIAFLSLLNWSTVLFRRQKKFDPSNRKYLPRIRGFSIAFVLASIGFALSVWYLS